ncbi:MAG TPA: alpha/beta hydrolase [Candidatus Sulfotelmatobacter sp.]|nr:alpha/beta hydrolase [Candidatus Sulfotelmatobacter sp.]
MRAFTPAWFVPLFILLSTGIMPAQEAVTFSTPDGYRLHADLYGKGDRGLVLAHGGRFTKESWHKQSEVFADAGFRVLAIDFRGYGQSWELGKETEDWKHYPDVLAAVRYLHNAGAKSVSVVGASMGGDAAGDAAAESNPGEIDRIVLLGSEGGDSPERLKGRKLFIVTRDDESGDGPRLPGITEHYRKAPDPKKLVVLEGSAHAQFIFETDQGPRLLQEILRFLSEH